MKTEFGPGEQFVGMIEPPVGEDVAGAFLEFGGCPIVIPR